MFKLQSPSTHSLFNAITYWDIFFYCSNWFLNLSIMILLVSLLFLFHLFHVGKMFPSEDTFPPEKQTKKVSQGGIGWIGRVGQGGSAEFGQKLLNTQWSVGRCTRWSTIMKWANVLKESSKKFTEAKCSLYYKGSNLQKMITVFWGPPSYIYRHIYTYTHMLPPFKARQVHGIRGDGKIFMETLGCLACLYTHVGKPRMMQAVCLSACLMSWPLFPSVAPIVAPVPLHVSHHHRPQQLVPTCVSSRGEQSQQDARNYTT